MNAWLQHVPHLLRPWWLLALLLAPLLWWLWRRRARRESAWTRAVDPHLLPGLLQAARGSQRTSAAWLVTACYLLTVLALAGPALRAQEATYAPQAPLVVVEDMSSHMLVADLAPSRMLRERLKVQQLITRRKAGQMGLVAYAGDAFTVAPLSDDAHSLDDLVVALSPDTMPADGQRADRALPLAAKLMARAGFHRGTILLLTDRAGAADIQAAREAHAKGYEVDVLGVGTASGAPLPTSDGTFSQGANGRLQIARLDASSLRTLASAGGGRYAQLTDSGDDLAALGVLDPASASFNSRNTGQSYAWRDLGPFLLLPLVILVALGFRRGWLAVALVAVIAMPTARVEAKQPDGWQQLWQRADQRADRALRSGDPDTAAALAQTPEQRAAAAYRKGDYAAAASDWSGRDSADANYNRGNALAELKKYDEAIDAWQRALRQRPGMADAQANINIVKKILRKQPKPESHKRDQNQQGQGQRGQQNQSQQDQQGQSRNQENMQRSQQQAQQNGSQSKQGQQQQSQQQQSQQQPASPGRDTSQQQSSRPRDASQPHDASSQSDASQQPSPDQRKQAQADAAERLALRKALQDASKPVEKNPAAVVGTQTTAQREQREANEVLMRRVPDDPGSLLKRKFQLEYQRRMQEGDR